jgi:predicted  nucleic acid-binding Zn-ribbon protein
MKTLDDKIYNLTQKVNSKMKRLNKLNAQIERANRVINSGDIKIQLKENLYKKIESIKNDILDLKDQFVNNSENSILYNIEDFVRVALEKFKDLKRFDKEIAKHMNISIDDINNKIEAIITLNNKRLKEVDALKLEITNLEDQINDLSAKSRAELSEGVVPDDKWQTTSHVKENTKKSKKIKA